MQIRRVTRDHAAAAYRATTTALLLPSLTPTTLAERLVGWDGGRSWGAFDDGAGGAGGAGSSGEELVGHARTLDLLTTVPGGARLRTAGVTSVGVLPTHTRRGVLRSMLTPLLRDERERGAVLSSLRASQAPIYGRFGYGLAGLSCDLEVAGGSRLRPDAAAPTHTVRLLPLHDVRRIVPEAHARFGCDHVGAVGRLSWWWDRLYDELQSNEQPHSRWVVGAFDAGGTLDGYADLALEDPPGVGLDPTRHRMAVGNLFAGSDGAYRALWAHVLGIDLVGTVVARKRPVDERLRWLLEDPRALRTTTVADEQWVRLLDVGAALAGRTYAPVDGAVVVGVRDALLPENDGKHRISADGAVPTDSAADVELDVAELGALYLGGVAAADLLAAGRIVERRPGAVAALDRLLRVTPAPWCGSFF